MKEAQNYAGVLYLLTIVLNAMKNNDYPNQQKRMVRIMMGYRNRVSCRSLFKKLEILPLTSQYILLLMLFVIKNKHLFILNTENHTKSTRQLNNLYHPITNLTVYQRGVHYMVIRIFNNLPPTLKIYLITSRNLKIV